MRDVSPSEASTSLPLSGSSMTPVLAVAEQAPANRLRFKPIFENCDELPLVTIETVAATVPSSTLIGSCTDLNVQPVQQVPTRWRSLDAEASAAANCVASDLRAL